jgi:hypothetical protein
LANNIFKNIFNVQDKMDALDIDIQQLDLTESSAGLSHKPDATRVPKG